VVLVAGCIDPDERPATWSYVHAAIIEPGCATPTCHGSLGARAGIVLQERDGAYRLLIDERYVVPGSASSSRLMFQLEGQETALMPPDAPLPAADVDLVRAWIVDGAPP
jgi:hypothetical protein